MDSAGLLLAAGVAIGVGFAAAMLASRRAVSDAANLAAGTRIPPFVIGITLLSIGTDLPEIANSIVASVTGHGDLNVGDSVGSAVTQATLVLGLLPLLGGAFLVGRRGTGAVGGATVGALVAGAVLMADGGISRADALFLTVLWVAGSALAWRVLPKSAQPTMQVHARDRLQKIASVLLALVVVAAGAAAAVWGLTTVASTLAVPEYLVAFFVASLGTSLPELIVDVTAIREGQRDLAVGDALGSSFVDATLSIAAGPLIAPVAVTASLVVPGSLLAALVIAAVVALLWVRRRHDLASGLALLAVYALVYLLWMSA